MVIIDVFPVYLFDDVTPGPNLCRHAHMYGRVDHVGVSAQLFTRCDIIKKVNGKLVYTNVRTN